MNKLLLLTFGVSTLAASVHAAVAADAEVATPEIQALFQQAEFWQGKQRQDLAKDALNRVLLAAPNNTQALYRLALIASLEGDNTEAKRLAEQLRQVAPNDPHLQELNIAQAASSDSGALKSARLLAANGQYEEAVSKYQTLFSAAQPPVSLAIEYYQTLSATKHGWTAAKAGLEQLAKDQPNSVAAAVAYGEVLTYREETRRAGIKLLSNYAAQDADANKAWRNALLWLAASQDDKALYDNYLQTHADDVAVAEYYKKKTTLTPSQQADRYRAVGYRELRAGSWTNASTSFNAALKINPQDADAIAGLGLIALQRKQFSAAAEQLSRAIKLAPAKQQQWQQAYQSAKFYRELAKARALEDASEHEQALALLRPLAASDNENARDAQLLQGEILQKQQRLNDAEVVYRKLLQANDKDLPARVGLVNVLRQQQRWDEASTLAEQLPVSAQSELGDFAASQAMMLRDRAASEPEVLAEATLRQASALAPDNPWVRLDLARLLDRSGRGLAAKLLINRGAKEYGSNDDYYVAALFAKDQQRWDEAIKQLQQIPAAKRNAAQNSLMESLTLAARLAEIERRQQVGDREGSRELMMDLYNHPPKTAAGVGQVADVLYSNGEPAMALLLIRQHNQQPPTAAVDDYLQQILVMIKAGAEKEADALLLRLSQRRDLAPADWQAIDKIRNAIAVAKADKLRQQERYAEAYDILAQRLRVAPEDESLLLAMARLYLSGDKGQKSLQIYRYAVQHHPDSDEAVKGAVETAIAINEVREARKMVNSFNRNKARRPEMLLLAAKVARAEGNDSRAVKLLQQSRQQLFQHEPAQPWLMASGEQAGFANPFASAGQQATNEADPNNPWQRPQWLPGSGSATSELATWDGKQPETQPSLAQQINDMLAEIHHERANTIQTGMEFKNRNGEAGLGKMAMVTTPSNLSIQVGNGRMDFDVTPTYLNGGNLSSGYSRLGYGAMAEAGQTLNEDLEGLPAVLDSIESTAYDYDEAQTLYEAALSVDDISPLQLAQYQINAQRAQRSFELATQQNLLEAIGLDINGLTEEQQSVFNGFVQRLVGDTSTALSSNSLQAFIDSRAQLESLVGRLRTAMNTAVAPARNPPVLHDAGVALSFGYSIGNFAMDIGNTPLGFEKVNMVGGISWNPQVSKNTQLKLGIERRAVEDSVLSYAGTADPMTGEVWGAVTKNGINVGVGFDDGAMGMYGNLGGYVYSGSHVDNNTAFDIAVGGYIRPINNKERQLQTGVHVAFQAFDKNLGHYSYGHGGYFSPQDYVSIAFPIKYSEQHENYNFSVNFAPGFQSFSEDSAPYFPNDPDLQRILDLLAQIDLVEQSVYRANSKTGFGMSLNAQGEYEFSSSFTLGGKLGFDNFGNYQETSAQLYLKYLLGVKSE
ncbi:cellulose synthase subunit BcsC-related outer membrane protein [Shewanella sp.]|uniref:cellulose biosynthesis protein BcsC n=1 Tax=Shewanella sp. TaxID=50422 RepID=UPI003A96C1C0